MTRHATQEERWDRERDYRKHDTSCARCGLLSGHRYPCTDDDDEPPVSETIRCQHRDDGRGRCIDCGTFL